MNKFGDFASSVLFDGDKISLEEVLDKEIIIKKYKISGSKYRSSSCLTLHIEFEKENRVIFTGSVVLMDQVKQYENMLPFSTIIKKFNSYYTFT